MSSKAFRLNWIGNEFDSRADGFNYHVYIDRDRQTHKSAQLSQKSMESCGGQSVQCQRVPSMGSQPHWSH